MYSKFNCKISDDFYRKCLNEHYVAGKTIYEEFKKQSENCLKPFLLDNGHIDGSALKENWFSIKNADVFISHSHNDLDKVKAFAGWLKNNFGLTAFIDSCAWGYCDDLIQLIDDRYCINSDGKTYNYKLRNYSTSHVHAMLSTALLEMIDRTECLIFFNTPQSICLSEELQAISAGNKEKTLSPWIFQELSTAHTILPRKPERYKEQLRENYARMDFKSAIEYLHVEYDVTAITNKMPLLNEKHLTQWQSQHRRGDNALDELYKIVSPN